MFDGVNADNGTAGLPNQSHVGQFDQDRKLFDTDKLDTALVEKIIDTMPQQVVDIIFAINNSALANKAKPKRLLLVGPPGVGKTTLAKVIGRTTRRPYKVIEAPFLLNEYKNSGPQNLYRAVMPIIEAGQPAVIIVDELTHLTKRNEDKNNSDPGTALALWLLLDRCAQYDHIFFVGTCNDLDDFPEQLKSRFGQSGIVHIPLPDYQTRKQVIEHHLYGLSHNCDERCIVYLAKKTKGKSVRDIQDFMMQAIRSAYSVNKIEYTVEQQHFYAILNTWPCWWHPRGLYHKIKPYIKPFWKDVLPTVLQIISLYLNYCSYCQASTQFGWNVSNAKKQFGLQVAAMAIQSKAFDFQTKTGRIQLEKQNEGLMLQEKSSNMQREGLKLQALGSEQQQKSYNLQAQGFEHQKQVSAKQEEMQKAGMVLQQASAKLQEKSFTHQKETSQKQLGMQQDSYKLQAHGFEHQKQVSAKQEEMQKAGMVLQQASAKLQEKSFTHQKETSQKQLDMQQDSYKLQAQGFEHQKQVSAKQEEMQKAGMVLQQASAKLQEKSFAHQKETSQKQLDMQQEGIELQKDGLRFQFEGAEPFFFKNFEEPNESTGIFEIKTKKIQELQDMEKPYCMIISFRKWRKEIEERMKQYSNRTKKKKS